MNSSISSYFNLISCSKTHYEHTKRLFVSLLLVARLFEWPNISPHRQRSSSFLGDPNALWRLLFPHETNTVSPKLHFLMHTSALRSTDPLRSAGKGRAKTKRISFHFKHVLICSRRLLCQHIPEPFTRDPRSI